MKTIALFAGAFAASFAFFSSEEGNAAWIRNHAADCMLDTWDADSGDVFVQWNDSKGFETNATGHDVDYHCALRESSSFLKQNVNLVNVHGEDRNQNANAAAAVCVTYWGNNNGGECGTTALSGQSFLGPFTLQPVLTKWAVAFDGDFGYVIVSVPSRSTANGTSTFRGYFISTP